MRSSVRSSRVRSDCVDRELVPRERGAVVRLMTAGNKMAHSDLCQSKRRIALEVRGGNPDAGIWTVGPVQGITHDTDCRGLRS